MARLPIMDAFTARGLTFTDLRTEGSDVKRAAQKEETRALFRIFPPEVLCAAPETLRAEKDRLSEQLRGSALADAISDLENIHALARMTMEDHNGDRDPLKLVVRRGNKIMGGWIWFGIRLLGQVDGRMKVAAHPFPIITQRATDVGLGRLVGKVIEGFLRKPRFTFDNGAVEANLVEVRLRLFFKKNRSKADRAVEGLIKSVLNNRALNVRTDPVVAFPGMNIYTVTQR